MPAPELLTLVITMHRQSLRQCAMRSLLLLLSGLLLSHAALASPAGIVCHVTYGGETQQISIAPSDSPYDSAPRPIGSYFLWRATLQAASAPLAAAHISIYAAMEGGPVPIHVASYPYPLPKQRRAPGFTGFHSVYEPMRDGELQYWCGSRP